MSRPLRIEYPDAWYHVMNRARQGEEAFPSKDDYYNFIDLLKDTSEMFNMRVAAYCLMGTHYHLLVQTPNANLSRCMRHINGVYTQRYNARHGCDGTLFRGRYKAILVDADSYLLELVRYIHRNPLRAGIVSRMDDYIWSTHKGYISKAKEWEWLHKHYILDLISKDKGLQTKAYKQFVSTEDLGELLGLYSRKNIPPVLGSESFISWVRGGFPKKKKEKEIPESKTLCAELSDVKNAICSHYKIESVDLLKSRRGVENEARDLAMYMSRTIRGERLEIIGQEFNLNNYSSVSTAIERARKKMSTNKFRKRYEQILDSLQR